MLGTPPTVAQEALQAQETPLQTWFSSWLDYLSANLPAIFIVVAVLVGILLLAKGGIKQMLVFAIAAALAFLLLTNLEAVAELFSNELPLPPDGAPGPPQSPDPAPSPD